MSPKKAVLSRRDLGRWLGLQALIGPALSWTAHAEQPSGSSLGAVPAAGAVLIRHAFVAMLVEHFGWVHSSQFVDAFKAVQPTYADVQLGVTPHALHIETALDEGLLDHTATFGPQQPITRGAAIALLAKAWGIDPESVPGAIGGRVDELLSATQARALLVSLTRSHVAPPQALCKSGTTAPRRYVRLSTPTAGATLRYTMTFDGSEPADPRGPEGQLYDFETDGVLQLVNPLSTTTDYRLYRLKAVALKAGLQTSAVRHFSWNIVRPRSGVFQAKLVQEGSDGSPRIWKIHNPAEYYQANAYYIEGSDRGLLFDAGEYDYRKTNLKQFVDTLAARPYSLVLGHAHPDHAEQVFNFTSAAVPLLLSVIERAALLASPREDMRQAGAAAQVLADGQVIDLGNVQITAWQIPGHTHGLSTIIINQTGQVFASDMWGCNRPHTADTTQYQGVKVDLFLSLVRQLVANYQRSSHSGQITQVTNAHQETPVGMLCVQNFLQCFQQLIDQGESAARPSIRGGRKGGDRMSMVGDMWRDRNWMAIGPIGKIAAPVDYLSRPTRDYDCRAEIDYNAPGGHLKYSQLAHVDFGVGRLVGVDVCWAPPANGIANVQSDKFDPWTYEYSVRVPAGSQHLDITPTAMSSRVRLLTVNGAPVKQGGTRRVALSESTRIEVKLVSPDGSSTSTYAFKVTAA